MLFSLFSSHNGNDIHGNDTGERLKRKELSTGTLQPLRAELLIY